MQENLEKRIKRQIIGKNHRFTAIVPLGFERTLVAELKNLGIVAESDHFEIVDGKVSFTAKIQEAWKTVAYSRIANRVLMQVADFRAENFRDLEKKAAEIPWELFLPCHPGAEGDWIPSDGSATPVSMHVTCKHSRLYHSDAVAERFYKVLKGGRLPPVRTASLPTPSAGTPRNAPPPSGSETQHLYVDFISDRCTVSLDLAGEELYKRGHQRFVNDAPLKETIAAAMLFEASSNIKPQTADIPFHTPHFTSHITLIDPMAGSGTFSLEAAYIVSGLIPGKCRDFALKHQPAFKEATWNYLTRVNQSGGIAKDSGPNPSLRIITSDISERAIEIIKHNVQTSPLPPDTITPQQKDFFKYTSEEISSASGTILLLNPPYGKRLDADAPALYAHIGKKLTELAKGAESPLTVAILAPKGACTENLLKNCAALAAPGTKQIKTSHGGISLNCFVASL